MKCYNYGVSFALGSTHGMMICTVCNEKVERGSYLFCEDATAYKVTHRRCVTKYKDLARFSAFDARNGTELRRLMGRHEKCLGIYKELGYVIAREEAEECLAQHDKLQEAMSIDARCLATPVPNTIGR